jgi:uncharacterized protein
MRLKVVAGLLFLANFIPAVYANDRGDIFGSNARRPDTLGDFDYGVCRGTDPRCYHDWGVPRPAKVLVYSRTAGPRHANLGPPLPAGLNPPLTSAHAVQNALKRWGEENGIAVDWTEDVAELANPGRLISNYKAIIFASPTRDTLWDHARGALGGTHLDAAKTGLRQYMRSGGGFVGIHNAFGTEYNWPYYEGLLGNANYYDHGANQDGVVEIVADDSSTEGLPKRWAFKDEWYNLIPFPTNVKFLAVVDESTLGSVRGSMGHPGHGNFHPVADAFSEGANFPGAGEFKRLIVGGIKSAMGLAPFCETHGHR